jgi:hypothetical protein
LAWRAVSADWLTVPVISSIDDAVSCRLDTVCSVRADRSWLPVAICAEAVDTDPTPWRTSVTSVRSLSTMADKTRVSWATSSRPSAARV